MDEEVAPALERENQIFSAPANVGNSLARESVGHGFGWIGTRQSCVGDLDVLDPASGERRCQARADRFDFGQLGHGALPAPQARTSSTMGRRSGSSLPIR